MDLHLLPSPDLISTLMPDLRENGADNFLLIERSSEVVAVEESPATKRKATRRPRRKNTAPKRSRPLVIYSAAECQKEVNSGNFPVLNSMSFLEPTSNPVIVNPQIDYHPSPSTVPFPPPPLNTVNDGLEDCKEADDETMEIVARLPKVTVGGISNIRAKIEGSYYLYNSDMYVICCCHRRFLTPPKFIRHAGGSDEESLYDWKYIIKIPETC